VTASEATNDAERGHQGSSFRKPTPAGRRCASFVRSEFSKTARVTAHPIGRAGAPDLVSWHEDRRSGAGPPHGRRPCRLPIVAPQRRNQVISGVSNVSGRRLDCQHDHCRRPTPVVRPASARSSLPSDILPWSSAYRARMDSCRHLGCHGDPGGQSETSVSKDTADTTRPLMSVFRIAASGTHRQNREDQADINGRAFAACTSLH
jgi:hypothetical protein